MTLIECLETEAVEIECGHSAGSADLLRKVAKRINDVEKILLALDGHPNPEMRDAAADIREVLNEPDA